MSFHKIPASCRLKPLFLMISILGGITPAAWAEGDGTTTEEGKLADVQVIGIRDRDRSSRSQVYTRDISNLYKGKQEIETYRGSSVADLIGGMAGVHQFVKIGRNAMIGGTSKLVQDVVPFTMVDGHPARAVGLNSVGISRAGIPLDVRRRIKQAYKILYRAGLNLTQAIAVIEQEVDSCEEIDHMLRFLRNAERGICRERHED